jgi:hypothetical protein
MQVFDKVMITHYLIIGSTHDQLMDGSSIELRGTPKFAA